jgi:hypothetical protein
MKKSFSFDFQMLYQQFDEPVTAVDCGKQCASQNPNGVPFCCDVDFAVPVAYHEEWAYLQQKTTMWRLVHDSDMFEEGEDDEVPDHMCLIACEGTAFCDRHFRAISCRQFPFYPYVTSELVFLGLSYAFKYEKVCWVLDHLDQVRMAYRQAFIRFYDVLFEHSMRDLYSYYLLSEECREMAMEKTRRIPLLHRNGLFALVDPTTEKISFDTTGS